MSREIFFQENDFFVSRTDDNPDIATIVLDARTGPSIQLPWHDFIQYADYQQQGRDLVLTGADGSRIIVEGFFLQATPPDLVSDTGLVINGVLAEKLAGPMAPGQYAQVGAGGTDAPIGQVKTLEGTVTATRADGTTVQLEVGESIFQGDIIETGPKSAIGLVFEDQSSFALGATGRVVLDEFVYDPATGAGSSVTSVVGGVFTFVSGQVAASGTDAMLVKTPVFTIGIRGTEGVIQGAAEGSDNAVSLLKGGPLEVCTSSSCVSLNDLGDTVVNTSTFDSPELIESLTVEQVIAIYGQEVETLYSNHTTQNDAHEGEAGLMDGATEEGEATPDGAEEEAAPAQEAAEQAPAVVEDYNEYIHKPESDGEAQIIAVAEVSLEEAATGEETGFTTVSTETVVQQDTSTEIVYREYIHIPEGDGTGGTGILIDSLLADTLLADSLLADSAPANTAPMVSTSARLVEVTADGLASGNLLEGVSDADGDILTVTNVSGDGLGTLTWNTDGSYSFLADNTDPVIQALAAGETTTTTLTATIDDGRGGIVTSTITLTITGVNDAPVTTDDALNVAKDPAAGAHAGNLLANDQDVDGDLLSLVDVVGGSGYGILTWNADGSYSYQLDSANPTILALNTGEILTEAFVYTVSDGQGGEAQGNFTVTINGLTENQAPTAVDDALSVTESATTPVSGDLLANDSDPDNDPLVVTAVTGGNQYGVLSWTGTGAYSYSLNSTNPVVSALNPGDLLTESYTYTIEDGRGGTATAQLTVTITGANGVPVPAPDTAFTTEADTLGVAIDLLANDTDPENDVLSVSTISGGEQYGTLTWNSDGTGSYAVNTAHPVVQALNNGETLSEVYLYTVTDSLGNTAETTLTVTIGGLTGLFLEGTAGPDLLVGASGADTLLGYVGADTLLGAGGDDILSGGIGSDTLVGSSGNDILDGGTGIDVADYSNDPGGVTISYTLSGAGSATDGWGGSDSLNSIEWVYGSEFDDVIDANWGPGFHTGAQVFGNGGNDSIIGTSADDILYGGTGDDTLYGGAGMGWDSLYGHAGNDLLQGGTGPALLSGGAGADTILGHSNADSLVGGTGNDWMQGRAGNDTLLGGAGDETMRGDGGNDVFLGGSGDDQMLGGSGNDTMSGEAGDDLIFGDAGNDSILGGSGDDRLIGGTGDDTLDGGAGVDFVSYVDETSVYVIYSVGGAGTATDSYGATDKFTSIENVIGSAYADTITASGKLGGGDTIIGGTGSGGDTLGGGTGAGGPGTGGDTLGSGIITVSGTDTLAGDTGAQIFGGGGNDIIVGGTGADSFVGGTGHDLLNGAGGSDTLIGGSGADTLIGGALFDRLDGGAGNDWLNGGNNPDTMTGGLGADTFYYAGAYDAVITDTITDFNIAQDKIVIDATLFNSPTLLDGAQVDGVNFTYLVGAWDGTNATSTHFLSGKPSFIYSEAQSTLYFDLDGNGSTTSYALATFSNGALIQASNIVIVNGLAGGTGSLITGGTGADSLVGTTLGDTIYGDGMGDTLQGLSGDDILDGGSGNDVLHGGAGADTLVGGSGLGDLADYVDDPAGVSVTYTPGGSGSATDGWGTTDVLSGIEGIRGSAFNDTISATGTAGADIRGRDGNDSIVGGSGDDAMQGDGGDDILFGGAGEDQIWGLSGNDTLYGGDGNDYLDGTTGDDVIYGDAGDDWIVGHFGADTVYGGSGSDTINASTGNDIAYGGIGADSIGGWTGTDTLYGQSGNDTLDGGNQNDRLYGGTGDDSLVGGTGNLNFLMGDDGADTLDGGLGSYDIADFQNDPGAVFVTYTFSGTGTVTDGYGNTDTVIDIEAFSLSAFADTLIAADDTLAGTANASVVANGGNDSLLGANGQDTFYGDAGDDILDGGGGDDQLWGGHGDDIIQGGAGNDAIMGDWGADSLVGGDGTDNIQGGTGNDTLLGGALNDYLRGQTGNDFLYGNSGADSLAGQAGDDLLDGATGADTLNGGGGADTLDGGTGSDSLTGGSGADSFLYADNYVAVALDNIIDFNAAEDVFIFDNVAFGANILPNGTAVEGATFSNIAGSFDGTNATNTSFLSGGPSFIYSQADQTLYYDHDGNTTTGYTAIATIANGANIQAANVEVINGI